jgi:hypothetical protein
MTDGITANQLAEGVVTVLSRTVELTDAQIKALPTTPLEVVESPGVGRLLRLVSGFYKLHLIVDYENLDAVFPSLFLRHGGSSALHSLPASASGFLDWGGPADVVAWMTPFFGAVSGSPVEGVGYDLNDIANSPFLVSADNGFSGDFTGGDTANTLQVTVYYTIIDV